ncbi:MAG: hypothetical protein BEN18_11185 [Epulopiscium sp. Nuni2H_MBin001]|nr:MAG: hypothetical protein BEN18_11185 [Epulopiscium sp. Nuni2H_MBin001]
MGDVFKEQLVKANTTKQELLKRNGYIFLAVLGSVITFIFLGTMFGGVITLIAVIFIAYIMRMSNKEYEYALTNSELDIDVIYSKQQRKKFLNFDLKSINVMASISDTKYSAEFERAQKVIDASDGLRDNNTYAVIYSKDGETVKVLITPNDDMLNLMYKQAPNKVHKFR